MALDGDSVARITLDPQPVLGLNDSAHRQGVHLKLLAQGPEQTVPSMPAPYGQASPK